MTTSKRTHQILSRHGGVLYECELPDAVPAEMAARYTLEKAVNARVFLIGANLAEANLAGAELTGASLMAANLSRANLSEADLSGANLVGAELLGVNLSGANLTGTRLAGASLKGFETVGDRPLLTLNPVGASEQALYAWLTKAGVYIQIGGAFCTREEFCAVIADMHGQGRPVQEQLIALALIDKHAELWLPKVPPDAKADTPDAFDADDDCPF